MLVDAAGLYFRAFFGVPTSMVAPSGQPVNAIRGFLDMSATLITRRRPAAFVACLDISWRPAFRVALLPSYKAHRVAHGDVEQVPDELTPQIPVLLDVLAAIGLARAGAEGYEADDVIATLADRASGPVEVVSGDRDLLGTVTDRVHLLYTGRGLAKMVDFGPDEVRERYGIEARHYADFAALRGDPSDGLPGVAGVGEKTAAALVVRFGSIEAILAAAHAGADGFPGGARAKVVAAADYLSRAGGVVRMASDAPVADVDDRLPRAIADPELLVELSSEYGLDASVNRMLHALQLS
jgi:5'-3' exonuclease